MMKQLEHHDLYNLQVGQKVVLIDIDGFPSKNYRDCVEGDICTVVDFQDPRYNQDRPLGIRVTVDRVPKQKPFWRYVYRFGHYSEDWWDVWTRD